MDITKEVLELVQKSLPEVQAKATAELMDEYKNLKESRPLLIKQAESLTKQLEEWLKIINSLTSELDLYKQKESEIYNRESALKKNEEEFSKSVYNERLKCYEMADKKIEKFFDRVFSNPVYKENIITNRIANMYYDGNQNCPNGWYNETYNKETFTE